MIRHWRKTIPALVWAAVLSLPAHRAVVIGIGTYTGDSLGTPPLLYADRDATLFYERFIVPMRIERKVLLTKDADYANVSYRIEQAIREAGENETVYLFFSARGIAWPTEKVGYVVTLSSSSSKPQSTAYSLVNLKDLLQSPGIRTRRVIVFADVNREPRPTEGNDIQRLFSDLGSPKVGGVLATKRGLASKLDHEARQGVFTIPLVNAVTQPGNLDWSQLMQHLKTRTRVEPEIFGGLTGAIVRPQNISLGLPRPPVLLAAMRLFPGLLALTPAGPCFNPADALHPRSLLDAVMAQRSLLSNEDWTECRESAALALASEGQKYVTRYGTTDLLPGDPLKVDRPQFSHAAESFQAALELFAGLGIGPQFEANLHQRLLFCKGMAEQSEQLLVQSHSRGTAPLPDIENAIGAIALESANLTRALTQFRLAKRLAPSWMYPRHNIALVLIEQGNGRAAETEYRQAIERAPWQPYLYYNLALLLQRGNRKKEAGQTYKKAIAAYDKAIATLTDRIKDWTADYPEDIRLAGLRIKGFQANKAIVLNAMGALAESSGNNKDALKRYNDAWQINADLCEARYNEAVLWQKRAGKRNRKPTVVSPEAAGLHEENIRICPLFLPSILESGRLALIGRDRASMETARTRLQLIRPKPPRGNTQKLHVLGQIHSALGDAKSAVEVLEDAVQKQESSAPNGHAAPTVYKDLALAYEKLGHPKACAIWIKASETQAPSPEQKEIRAKANACSKQAPPRRP